MVDIKNKIKAKYPSTYFKIRNLILGKGKNDKKHVTEYVFHNFKHQHENWFTNPKPWYTLDSVAWLDKNIGNDFNVLELGSGRSTLWWLKKAQKVHCVEASPDWAIYLLLELYDKPELMKKIDLYFSPSDWNPYGKTTSKPYWKQFNQALQLKDVLNLENGYLNIIPMLDYDVIIFDGSIRNLTMVSVCSSINFEQVKIIVVDNTENPFCSLLSDKLIPNNYKRLDFIAGEKDDIPKHQMGKHITSVYVDKEYYKRTKTPDNLQSIDFIMSDEKKKKHQIGQLNSVDFENEYKKLLNRLRKLKNMN